VDTFVPCDDAVVVTDRTPSLDGWFAKLDHADEFIHQLRAMTSDRYAKPAKIDKHDAFDHGRRVLTAVVRVVEVPDVPVRWSLAVGDAVHNMRAALDYLAYELVALNDGGVYDEQTQFPIGTAPTKSGHSRLAWRTILLLGEHWEIIERAQPYHDPENIYPASLGLLRDLSNKDKHRLLVPASIAADVSAVGLVQPEVGSCRLERAKYHDGVIEPGTVLATEEFLALTDEPRTILTPWYQPTICFAEWPTLAAHEALAAAHRRIEDLVTHFRGLF
jgi:hypothetical protein